MSKKAEQDLENAIAQEQINNPDFLDNCKKFDQLENRLQKRPTWELKAIVKALSIHSWNNTLEENQRLGIAKHIISIRNQSKKSK